MRRGALLATVGLLAATATAPASAASPDAASRQSAQLGSRYTTAFLYAFDAGETLRPGTRVNDVSGHRQHGTVLVQAGGRLALVNHQGAGRAAGYPPRCTGCGRAIIEVNRLKGLNPAQNAFKFGATILLRKKQVSGNANLIQKGYFNQAGQYKLQVDGGVPACSVNGSAGRVVATPAVGGVPPLTDGSWHALSCTRAGKNLTLRVDGRVAATTVGRIGTLHNRAPVRIGGAKIGRGNRQYHGSLDNVYLKIRR